MCRCAHFFSSQSIHISLNKAKRGVRATIFLPRSLFSIPPGISIRFQCGASFSEGPSCISNKGKVHEKSKKKLTSVSFMYVCVAKNAELLYFFLLFFAPSP